MCTVPKELCSVESERRTHPKSQWPVAFSAFAQPCHTAPADTAFAQWKVLHDHAGTFSAAKRLCRRIAGEFDHRGDRLKSDIESFRQEWLGRGSELLGHAAAVVVGAGLSDRGTRFSPTPRCRCRRPAGAFRLPASPLRRAAAQQRHHALQEPPAGPRRSAATSRSRDDCDWRAPAGRSRSSSRAIRNRP